MSDLTPMSFRFTEDVRNKIKWTAKVNKVKPVQLLTQLLEEQFTKDLDAKLQDIITGRSVNPVDELVELLELNFISKEYFLYSMYISQKLKGIVSEKLKQK